MFVISKELSNLIHDDIFDLVCVSDKANAAVLKFSNETDMGVIAIQYVDDEHVDIYAYISHEHEDAEFGHVCVNVNVLKKIADELAKASSIELLEMKLRAFVASESLMYFNYACYGRIIFEICSILQRINLASGLTCPCVLKL